MRTIGLIGGMSWESTHIYSELLNRGVQRQLGALHSAQILLTSLDMARIATLQMEGGWEEAGAWLALEAVRLERAGAEVLALATNTMHKCAPQITSAISVPFLHIVDPLIATLHADHRNRPLLLGTRFTMEERFFLERLESVELEPLVPPAADRTLLHGIIYEELCKGVVSNAAVEVMQRIVSDGRSQGADSLILGCTELCMLVKSGFLALQPYDTTAIHAGALVDFSLSTGEGSA
jgi:aspartate racemase